MRQSQYRIVCAFLILISIDLAFAQESPDEELAQAYGNSVVSIATGSQQPVARAPATASVITAEDIEAMGATDLDQVLESVPGLHVSVSSVMYNSIYSFRGITTAYNPQVLFLVNGIPITSVFLGNRSEAWGGMPLENVSRIEIIRGPGSALYGADAFSGVINIRTKTASDIKDTEFGVRAGTFNTKDAWIQSGGKLGPLDAAFYFRLGHTDGQHRVVQQDLQSSLDKLFATNASLAPGSVNAVRNALDLDTDLSYNNQWRFRARYQQREVGTGAGISENLDSTGRMPETRLYLDLTYQNVNWAPNWDVSAVLGYYGIKERPGSPAFMLFPAGAFNNAFPSGVIGNPGHAERHTHASLDTSYTGFDKHKIRLGTGFRVEDLYETTELKNYTFVTVPGVGVVLQPLPSLVDVTGDPNLVYLQPHKRNISYAFIQDEWRLAKDWVLTAGVRQDHYSDFGNTTNPRLALVWDAAYNVVIKAMHGRAFRAPAFVEQYNINNPVAIGNPSLRPETISTDELAFAWQPTPTVQTNLSLFHYRMNDIIRFVPNADPTTGSAAQNSSGQTGRGVEFEAAWEATQNLKLTGSFSVQHSTDDATGQDAGLAPHRRFFARSDWRFQPLWQLGTIVNHVADRMRQPGDARPQVPDYTTVDLTLRREKVLGDWDVRASIFNLFNQDAREPSLAPGNIPFDLPLPGRTFYIQFQHKL